MINEELLSKTINFLRFPLIVGVVFIHNDISSVTMQGIKYEFNNPEWYYYIIDFFSQVLSRISVPLFFFISGFLFFYHANFNLSTYKNKLKSRIKTLLIPYLLWNLIGFLIFSIKHLQILESVFPSIANTDYNLSVFFDSFYGIPSEGGGVSSSISNTYPVNFPFWFIRDLMISVLLAPGIHWLVSHIKIGYILILGICWYGAYWWTIPEFSIVSIFFFSLGAYFSILRINLLEFARKLYFAPFVYVIIAIVDTITKGEDYNSYIHKAGILFGIISAFIIVSYLIDKGKVKVSKFLSDSSFFIFASHGLFIGLFMKALFIALHPQSPYLLIFIYFFIPITTILICMYTYKGLNKFYPNIAKILTGGR